MAKFVQIFPLALLTLLEVATYTNGADPKWFQELKDVCKGASDPWYVDRDEPKCCKCDLCDSIYDPVIPDCPYSAQCESKSLDCIYVYVMEEDEIKSILNAPSVITTRATITEKNKTVENELQHTSTTKIPKTIKGKHWPISPTKITETVKGQLKRIPPSEITKAVKDRSEIKLSSTAESSNDGRNHTDSSANNPWMWMALVAVVAALVAMCVFVCFCIAQKHRRSLFGICMLREKSFSRSESSDVSVANITKSSDSREEEEGLIKEKSCCGNQAPPPRRMLSESGPQGLWGDLGMNVTRACPDENSASSSYDPSQCGQSSRLTNSSNYGPLVQTRGGNFETLSNGMRHQQQGCEYMPPAPQPLIQANGSSTINVQNLNFYASSSSTHGQHCPNQCRQQGGESISQAAPAGQSSVSRRENFVCQPDARPQACFPTLANDGEVHTSASPPLSRQVTEHPGMCRQSSEISSSSASGPVENGSLPSFGRAKWSSSSARTDQQQEFACHQVMPSTNFGHVQHSNTSEKSFHSDFQHQSSCEESYAVSVSPQSDVTQNSS